MLISAKMIKHLLEFYIIFVIFNIKLINIRIIYIYCIQEHDTFVYAPFCSIIPLPTFAPKAKQRNHLISNPLLYCKFSYISIYVWIYDFLCHSLCDNLILSRIVRKSMPST